MKQKKVGFFKRVKKAITNFDEYKIFAEEKVSVSIKYLLKLMFIFVILITIGITIRLTNEANKAIQIFREECPDFKFEDNNLIKTENNEEGELNKIYFNVEEFLTLNSSYSEFEINLHFSVSAVNSNLEGNLSGKGEGISLYSLNKSNESSTISKVLYDTYPTLKTDLTYKFKESDDISEIGVKVDATIINSEQEELSKVKIDSSSFYFSVLGVAK